jgi:hypothetical protein
MLHTTHAARFQGDVLEGDSCARSICGSALCILVYLGGSALCLVVFALGLLLCTLGPLRDRYS